MTQDERDELMLRYLDGNVTPTELAQLEELLRADPDSRGWLCELATQAVTMADFGREETLKRPRAVLAETVIAGPWWRRPSWLAWAAGLVLFLGLAAVWWWSEPNIAVLTQASGAVTWSAGRGERKVGLEPGAQLRAGTLETLGEVASAQLRFGDGTVVTLGGDVELQFEGNGQKQFRLKRGSIMASVVPQRAGRLLVVRTPTAELEVRGTEFTVTVKPEKTALEVHSGTVRLRRLVDGKSVEVTGRQHVVASLDARAAMDPVRPTNAPTVWRHTLAEPPAQFKGHWLPPAGATPGRVRAVPYTAAQGQDGRPLVHYGIYLYAWKGEPEGFVALTPHSTLRFRYRMQREGFLKVFMTCQTPAGGWAGNFEGEVPQPATPPDADGWRTAEVPLASLPSVEPRPNVKPTGTRIYYLLFHSVQDDRGLEIAEVAIADDN